MKKPAFYIEISYRVKPYGARQVMRMGNNIYFETYEDAEEMALRTPFMEEWIDPEFTIVPAWIKDDDN